MCEGKRRDENRWRWLFTVAHARREVRAAEVCRLKCCTPSTGRISEMSLSITQTRLPPSPSQCWTFGEWHTVQAAQALPHKLLPRIESDARSRKVEPKTTSCCNFRCNNLAVRSPKPKDCDQCLPLRRGVTDTTRATWDQWYWAADRDSATMEMGWTARYTNLAAAPLAPPALGPKIHAQVTAREVATPQQRHINHR